MNGEDIRDIGRNSRVCGFCHSIHPEGFTGVCQAQIDFYEYRRNMGLDGGGMASFDGAAPTRDASTKSMIDLEGGSMFGHVLTMELVPEGERPGSTPEADVLRFKKGELAERIEAVFEQFRIEEGCTDDLLKEKLIRDLDPR